MSQDIYVFGSAVRGDVSVSSDIDILVIPAPDVSQRGYPMTWSVYSRETISKYYSDGRLFAWHLHLESRCIYCASDVPWLHTLGSPAPYGTAQADISSLYDLMQAALTEIDQGSPSVAYELGLIYTAIRDIAMSASWSAMDTPCFSRRAPYLLPSKCPLPEDAYSIAMAARHCSARGGSPDVKELDHAVKILLSTPLAAWVNDLKERL